MPLAPYSTSHTTLSYQFEVTLPPNLEKLVLEARLYGSNGGYIRKAFYFHVVKSKLMLTESVVVNPGETIWADPRKMQ